MTSKLQTVPLNLNILSLEKRRQLENYLLGIFTILFLLIFTQEVKAQIQPQRSGANLHSFSSFPMTQSEMIAVDTALNSGVKIIRVILFWPLHQFRRPNPGEAITATIGKPEWQNFINRVRYIHDRGGEVYVTLFWSPRWSSGFPIDPGADPVWYCLKNDTPECFGNSNRFFAPQNDDLKNFITFAVREVGHMVKYWGGGNEMLVKPRQKRLFWWGSLDQLDQYFKTFRESVKSVDPSLKIIGPDEDDGDELLSILRMSGDSFDIISGHAYPWPSIERFNFLVRGSQDNPYGFKQAMEIEGKGKQFWLTEFGEWPNDPNTQFTQFAYMLNEVNYHSWIHKWFAFTLEDVLFDSSGQPRPAWALVKHYAGLDQPSGGHCDIDPSIKSLHFVDLETKTGSNEYVLLVNRSSRPITVKMRWVKDNGWTRCETLTLEAESRSSIDVNSKPWISGQDVSLTIQALNSSDADYLYGEHSTYSGPGWQSGRNSEGSEPSLIHYFAEGAVSPIIDMEDWITIVNPTAYPIKIRMRNILESGEVISNEFFVRKPFGREKIRIKDISGITRTIGHSSIIEAFDLNNNPVTTVTERTICWNNYIDCHSSIGSSLISNTWYFAEGVKSDMFQTFILLFNPNPYSIIANMDYVHENKLTYKHTVTIQPNSRLTVSTPAQVPQGGFGLKLQSTGNISAERSVYWSTSGIFWSGGHNSTGTLSPGIHWLLAEGTTGNLFDSFILVLNPNNQNAIIQINFFLDQGRKMSRTFTIGPNSRQTIWVDGLEGLGDTPFASEIISINSTPIVVERAMYWGFNWYGGHSTTAKKIR